MIIGVIHTEYIKEYQLKVMFDNNISKVVDLANFLNGEVFEPLKDVNYFKQVKVDEEIDTIAWNNGADFSPEFLYEIGKQI